MRSEPAFVEIQPRTSRLGHTLLHLHSVTSTQEVAWNRAREGAQEGLVVVADEQTKGHGRRGRGWTSIGHSLYASVLLRPQRPATELLVLPLLAGVAAAAAVRRLTRLDVGLKWPNDLVHGDRKLGGVLIDAVYGGSDVPDYVLVGLGINGDARPEDFPQDLRATSTSLSIAAARHVCLPALLKIFLEQFEARYDRLMAGDAASTVGEARERTRTLGRRVRVETTNGPLEGVAHGLGPHGELLVTTDAGERSIRSGECQELRDA